MDRADICQGGLFAIIEQIAVCRDANDDRLLEVAVDPRASTILSYAAVEPQ